MSHHINKTNEKTLPRDVEKEFDKIQYQILKICKNRKIIVK